MSTFEGKEVVRTGRGSAYRERKSDPWTGRVTSSRLVESQVRESQTLQTATKDEEEKEQLHSEARKPTRLVAESF